MLMLQWSHVFSDMVRWPENQGFSDPTLASMEPCLFRHGKQKTVGGHIFVDPASMEPCLFRHGKDTRRHGAGRRRPRFNGAMSFQTW